MPSFNSSRPLKRTFTLLPLLPPPENSKGNSEEKISLLNEYAHDCWKKCSEMLESVNQQLSELERPFSEVSPETLVEKLKEELRRELREELRNELLTELRTELRMEFQNRESTENIRNTEDTENKVKLLRTELNALTRKVERMGISVEDLDKTTTRKKELEPLLNTAKKVDLALTESVKKKAQPRTGE